MCKTKHNDLVIAWQAQLRLPTYTHTASSFSGLVGGRSDPCESRDTNLNAF